MRIQPTRDRVVFTVVVTIENNPPIDSHPRVKPMLFKGQLNVWGQLGKFNYKPSTRSLV